MLKALWLAILLFLNAWPAAPGAEERYLASYNGFGVGAAPLWATKDLGLFTKYGLNPDLVMSPDRLLEPKHWWVEALTSLRPTGLR